MDRFLPPALKASSRIILVGLVLILAIGGCWIFFHPQREEPARKATISQRQATTRGQVAPSEVEGSGEELEEDARSIVRADWDAFRAWLKSGPNPEEIEQRLKELRSRWVALDPQALAEAIGELLASGEDAVTG